MQDVYSAIVSEGEVIDQYVTRIQATDNDQDDHLLYSLGGDGSEMFSINSATGIISTARQLDREQRPRYHLLATVSDRAQHQCTAKVDIRLSDVNDNPPKFDLPEYTLTVPENTDRNTLLIRVHATDADIGINRKISYSIKGADGGGHFKIDKSSGIVNLVTPVDRELHPSFRLRLEASDHGQPKLSSTSVLNVLITDINDNPPEFERKVYTAAVNENMPVGSNILRVFATSRDTGVNAQITYTIAAGNEHGKFSIDPSSGVISVAETMDYEISQDYFLTVQANDGGTPSLSNIASVTINVTDSNDNPPLFAQNSYSAQVHEDAQSDDIVIRVMATDADSAANSVMTYSLVGGNIGDAFTIDAKEGTIKVAQGLDRETISSYTLQVHAVDSGKPPLSSLVDVHVEVMDANDNAPRFIQGNLTLLIQEDKPIGFSLISFEVVDEDIAPNGEPFTFDILSGNEGRAFRMVPDGTLRTAKKFDSKICDSYTLQVRVFDNGVPPMFSDTWVFVSIIEESQYPPEISPLNTSINSYLDEFPGGVIGKVHT